MDGRIFAAIVAALMWLPGSANAQVEIDKETAHTMVTRTCQGLRRVASFQISPACDFTVENVAMFGNDAVIDVFSKGFIYNIRFRVTYAIELSNNGEQMRYTIRSVDKI